MNGISYRPSGQRTLRDIYHSVKKKGILSFANKSPSPPHKNTKFLKTVYIELNN